MIYKYQKKSIYALFLLNSTLNDTGATTHLLTFKKFKLLLRLVRLKARFTEYEGFTISG